MPVRKKQPARRTAKSKSLQHEEATRSLIVRAAERASEHGDHDGIRVMLDKIDHHEMLVAAVRGAASAATGDALDALLKASETLDAMADRADARLTAERALVKLGASAEMALSLVHKVELQILDKGDIFLNPITTETVQ